MEKKYLQYTIEEFIEDNLFIAWVLKGNENNKWENFIKATPEINTKVEMAREIILLFRDTYDILDEESVLEMWHNIDLLDQKYKKKVRRIELRRTLSWAASILIIFSFGTMGYYFLNEKSTNYQFTSTEDVSQVSSAKLILPDGEEIRLNSDNSTVSLNSENELVIINDSVIDLSHKKIEAAHKVKMNEVVIPYGKRSELLLADGTKVWLNAGSRLAFPTKFTEKTREVFLEGEAYFEVKKSESQPFIVNVGQLDIKVLGTHFDISAYPADNRIETVLLEGSIMISRPTVFGLKREEILLKPNQKANFYKERSIVEVSDEPNADIYIAWIEGWLQFSKESLQSVFNKLERYYNVEIRIDQNFPSSELISGKLDLKESLEDVMQALGDVATIEYRTNGKIIYINKKIKKLQMK